MRRSSVKQKTGTFEMFAKSADWKSGVAEIFEQVVPETWASHTEWSFAKRAVAAWYKVRMIGLSVDQSKTGKGSTVKVKSS